MNGKYKSLGKDILIFAIGTIGSKIILFLLVPLYTNVLTKSEYGTAELIFSVGQLVVPCVSLTIYDALLRYGLMADKEKSEALYVTVVVFFVGTLVTIALAPVMALYQPIKEWVFYLLIYVIVSFASQVMLIYLKVKNLNKIYSFLSILQALLLIVFNLFFLVLLGIGVSGYLLSSILSSFVVTGAAFIMSGARKDIVKARFNPALFKEMITYSSPLILNSISWWFIHSSDKVMVEAMLGVSMLGLYTAASKIPSLLNVVTSIFNQAWGLASIKEYDTTNDKKLYSDVFDMFVSFIFSAFIFICLIVKPFMSIYVGDEFFEAWRYVPILLLSACFSAISSFMGAFYSALKKSKNVMITTVIAGICNIIVNFFGIKMMGVWGAAVGTLIAYVLIAIVRMIDVLKFLPIHYNLRKFIPVCVISLAVAVLYSFNIQTVLNMSVCIVLFLMTVGKDYLKVLKVVVSAVKERHH